MKVPRTLERLASLPEAPPPVFECVLSSVQPGTKIPHAFPKFSPSPFPFDSSLTFEIADHFVPLAAIAPRLLFYSLFLPPSLIFTSLMYLPEHRKWESLVPGFDAPPDRLSFLFKMNCSSEFFPPSGLAETVRVAFKVPPASRIPFGPFVFFPAQSRCAFPHLQSFTLRRDLFSPHDIALHFPRRSWFPFRCRPKL